MVRCAMCDLVCCGTIMICGVGRFVFIYRVSGRRRDMGKTRTTYSLDLEWRKMDQCPEKGKRGRSWLWQAF